MNRLIKQGKNMLFERVNMLKCIKNQFFHLAFLYKFRYNVLCL
jgi:hypothetical protein